MFSSKDGARHNSTRRPPRLPEAHVITRYSLLGENRKESTALGGSIVNISFPVAAFQNFMAPSDVRVARVLASGQNPTPMVQTRLPFNESIRFPEASSEMFTNGSSLDRKSTRLNSS